MATKITFEPFFRMLGALGIILLFGVLIFNYYGNAFSNSTKQNVKFIEIDLDDLQKEADLIIPPQNDKLAKNVFVLTYHRVTKEAPTRDFEISYEQFKNIMFEFKRQGYDTITVEELYSFMKGEIQIPDKSFMITFDDGARVSFYNADPILKALDYNAVIFVISGHLDSGASPYYLNKTELVAIKATGRWDIQSHTDESHFRLPTGPNGEIGPALTNKLWLEAENRLETDEEYFTRVSQDLETSKIILEESIKDNIIAFALPYGDFGERNTNYPLANSILSSLTSEKFKLTFYEFPLRDRAYRASYNDIPNQESYLVSRIAADGLRSPEELLERIEATHALDLPYTETFSNKNQWVRITGEASVGNDFIKIFAGEFADTQRITAYLDGSYLWKDYDYSIQLREVTTQKVSLISRYNTPHDYISCLYTNNSVSIMQFKRYSAPLTILSQASLNSSVLSENVLLGMSVHGNKVSCLVNGNEKVSSEVLGIPSYGGIGVTTQDFTNPERSFTFGQVNVNGNTIK